MFAISPLVLHTVAVSVMGFAWSKIGSLPYDEMISKQKGGQLQFLTIQAYVTCLIRLQLAPILVSRFPDLWAHGCTPDSPLS